MSLNPYDFSTQLFGDSGLGAGVGQDYSAAFNAPSTGGGGINMGQVGSFMSAGGDILGGIGGYIQGQEVAGADEYNANLALEQGQFQVEQIGLKEASTLATQKAIYAKAGVEAVGSPLDVALNTATNFELDKQVANYNAQSAANMDNYEAAMAKQKGEFALASGLMQGGTSLAMAFA